MGRVIVGEGVLRMRYTGCGSIVQGATRRVQAAALTSLQKAHGRGLPVLTVFVPLGHYPPCGQAILLFFFTLTR